MSPRRRRLTRCFVRLPSRAIPRTSRGRVSTAAGRGFVLETATGGVYGPTHTGATRRGRLHDPGRAPRLRGLEQLAGVAPRAEIGVVGAEHSNQLPFQLVALEPAHVGARRARRRVLG